MRKALRDFCGLALAGFCVLTCAAVGHDQRFIQAADNPKPTDVTEQELGQRIEIPAEAVSVEGLVRLDVTVTDQAGKAVTGLQRADFRLLDNGQPQKLIAFHAANSRSTDPEDSLAVIVLLDSLDLPPHLGASERQQVAQFLCSKSRNLAHPVTIYSLENPGFFLTAKSSTDGKLLAADVASDTKVQAYFLAPKAHLPLKAEVEPSLDRFPALAGLRALWTIATAEASRPGRKLLFWIGPGLGNRGTGAFAPDGKGLYSIQGPVGYSTSGDKDDEIKRDLFQKICWFSTLLRQARVTLDCFSLGEDEPAADEWSRILSVVPSVQQPSWLNLFKNVLAVQSGGRILPSSNGLVEPMNSSIENAQIFYSLTFDPPLAVHANEYHSLKVELSHPSLSADTSAGYFDQPFFNDPPDLRTQRITVSQLEQIVRATRTSIARQPSDIVLTERLSQLKQQALLAELHDKKLRNALELIADESTFLDPPCSELTADPPPDKAEQQQILNAAADYLDRVIPKLPDFYATRTAVYFGESASYPELATTNASQPLHAERQSKETVLYRKGEEIVISASKHNGTEVQPLRTYGTFGPILNLLRLILKSQESIDWESWQQTTNGRLAVFRYRLVGVPTLYLKGCCYPNGHRDARNRISADSHGEFVVDPGTGAILRFQAESELPGFVPTKRSDMMVSYGPMEIGGNTYIVPLRSVNIWRSRSVVSLPQWDTSFATWGPYETQMNVFTFDQYHMFRGNSRVLPGFEQVPGVAPTGPH